MRVRLTSSLLSPLLCAGLACGGDDDPGGGSPDGGADTTAPSVVSISPDDGATGQRADVAVTIVFSEPMDRESVEGTLDTEDLGEVTLGWNAAGDTLTITPVEPLAYAEGIGADPAQVEPETYTVTLGSAALDLAGNPLGPGVQTTFATLKRMSHVFELEQALTRSMTADEELLNEPDDPLVIGDLASDEGARALVTFDITLLPESAVEVVSAVFATRQQIGDNAGQPYGQGGLGAAVLIDHVSFSELDNAAFNASQNPHAQLGELCVEDQVIIEKDVTAAVDDDRANRLDRDDRSQFLLRFELDNDGDGAVDRAVISRDLSELQVSYLAP